MTLKLITWSLRDWRKRRLDNMKVICNLPLDININNFEINYNSIDNSDKFQRKVLLDFTTKYTDSINNTILLQDKYVYQDTISESEISKVENTNFPISIGKKNKEESTFSSQPNKSHELP